MAEKPERAICHDCGAKEGELHNWGCDMEVCPFCGGQLISCGCEYHLLGYDYQESPNGHPTCGLPQDVYENGLSKEQWDTYIGLLLEKRRIPWIQYPNLCVKCGKLWPDMFMVPNEEWARYVEPGKRDEMLCRDCWNFIKAAVDRAAEARAKT